MENNFNKWFIDKLQVKRFPLPGEISKMLPGGHIINVSDEYIHYNANAALAQGIYHHWFPLNECTGHMGLNSLFAAMCVLHEAESKDLPVVLHCHAGANRSPTVAAAYYYLRTGHHLEQCYKPGTRLIVLKELNGTTLQFDERLSTENEPIPNMLLSNCQQSLLPPLPQMEKFLNLLGTYLEVHEPTHRAGVLTQLKYDLGLQ